MLANNKIIKFTVGFNTVNLKLKSTSNEKMFEIRSQEKTYLDNHHIENEVVERVDQDFSTFSFQNYSYVEITDNLSKDTQTFKMKKNKDGVIDLLNINNIRVGEVCPWYSEDLPEELKNKDGIVKDPHTGEELLEYKIFNTQLSLLPENTYREYKYLKNHKSLQQTHEIENKYF